VRIDLERTGGVAGIRLATTTASDSLPEPAARELTRLVDASGFFALPARIDADGAVGDRFTYTITIDDGSRSHTVTGERRGRARGVEAADWLADAVDAARAAELGIWNSEFGIRRTNSEFPIPNS